jgi:hypothetical protein
VRTSRRPSPQRVDVVQLLASAREAGKPRDLHRVRDLIAGRADAVVLLEEILSRESTE